VRTSAWGGQRERAIVGGDLVRVLRPRHTRCRDGGATQVLLPAGVLVDRADSAAIIGWALSAAAGGGWGHRRIAVAMAVPAAMVRG
jgi:hypothetical protein